MQVGIIYKVPKINVIYYSRQLTNRNYERSVLSSLTNLCMSLKKNGPQLEHLYKDQLDKLGVSCFFLIAC